MPSGTPKRIAGPAYVAASATNIYTPAASTIRYIIRGMSFTNKDTVPRTVTIYIGATGGSAGGTELIAAKVLQAGETWPWYAPSSAGLVMVSTDFLTGIASAASAIVITVLGETITDATA